MALGRSRIQRGILSARMCGGISGFIVLCCMTVTIPTQRSSAPKKRGTKVDIDVSAIIALFAQIAGPAFTVAFVFAFGSKLVHSFLSMGFDGRFKL